jgi:hypothetical protein
MSRKNNYSSLDSMLSDMANTVTSVQLPDKISILKNNTQSGGSNGGNNVNKLLSMLATESQTSQAETQLLEHELRNMLELKGGRNMKPAEELKAFFKKYNIKTINGIKSNKFIEQYAGDENENDNSNEYLEKPHAEINNRDDSDDGDNKTSEATTSEDTSNNNTSEPKVEANTESDTSVSGTQDGGARGMNPGFKAFIDLKKTIAEKLGIPNGPKAAKIAGAIQKEMKVKYADLTSVQLAAKGLEHFEKDPSKYKKMV